MEEKRYSTNLTGAWFLFYEIKEVVKLMIQGLEEKEAKLRIKEENLFQRKKSNSITRVLATVYRRAYILPLQLKKLLLEDSIDNGKLINLYAIMEEDLLFKEFMIEVIQEKYRSNNLFIEIKDTNTFFTEKAEQNKTFSKYTDGTIAKLKQVYFKILMDSGILEDRKTGQLNRILFDPYLKGVFENNGGKYFIDIFK